MRFADNVRALEMPAGVHLGGGWFVFADVLDAVLTDGPRATLAAALGAMLIVLLVLGRNRYAFVTIACGASGTLLMIGAAALLGFKVNFLDFVALPITIGIGIEYAVNIVTRARQEGPDAQRCRPRLDGRRRVLVLVHDDRRLRLVAVVAEPRDSLVRPGRVARRDRVPRRGDRIGPGAALARHASEDAPL